MRLKSLLPALCRMTTVSVLITIAAQARADNAATVEYEPDPEIPQSYVFNSGDDVLCTSSDVPNNCATLGDTADFSWGGDFNAPASGYITLNSGYRVSSEDYVIEEVYLLCDDGTANGVWSTIGCGGDSSLPGLCRVYCINGYAAKQMFFYYGVLAKSSEE